MDTVHNFSYGLVSPGLAYGMSCLGAFLGLRCVTIGRAHEGPAKARWLAKREHFDPVRFLGRLRYPAR